MHQRSWRTLIAGGAALAVGVTLTAFGAPAHAAGIPGITSEARAQDEVMNYAVNLTDDASRYDFNAAVSKASENGVVLAQYPEFNTFFVQSVKVAFTPTLGKSLVDAGISYQSIGPTRYKTVTGSEVRTEHPQTTASEANAVVDAAGTHVAGTIAAAHNAYGVDGVAPSATIDKASPNDVEGAAVERNVVGGIDVPAMVNDSVVSVAAVALPTGTDPATATLERSKFSNYGKNSVEVAAPRLAHLVDSADLEEGPALRLPVRHLDGLPARRGRRRADQADPPGLHPRPDDRPAQEAGWLHLRSPRRARGR